GPLPPGNPADAEPGPISSNVPHASASVVANPAKRWVGRLRCIVGLLGGWLSMEPRSQSRGGVPVWGAPGLSFETHGSARGLPQPGYGCPHPVVGAEASAPPQPSGGPVLEL